MRRACDPSRSACGPSRSAARPEVRPVQKCGPSRSAARPEVRPAQKCGRCNVRLAGSHRVAFPYLGNALGGFNRRIRAPPWKSVRVPRQILLDQDMASRATSAGARIRDHVRDGVETLVRKGTHQRSLADLQTAADHAAVRMGLSRFLRACRRSTHGLRTTPRVRSCRTRGAGTRIQFTFAVHGWYVGRLRLPQR